MEQKLAIVDSSVSSGASARSMASTVPQAPLQTGVTAGTVSTKVIVEFRPVWADREPARSLIVATLAEYERIYGNPRGETPSATAAEMGPPEGAFLVAYEDGRPVGCGGLKRLADVTAEIKRMYVVPEARSRGLGRSLLSALEEEAKRLGYRRARLDTGARQPHARTLYGSAGYAAISDYNRNPYADYWGEKRLWAPAPHERAGT